MNLLNFLKVKKFDPSKGTSEGTTMTWSWTKIGTLIAGIGVIAVTVGNMMNGNLELSTGISTLGVEIGSILAIFGVSNTLTDSIVSILQGLTSKTTKRY